jgi:hypothetical protein
MTFREWVLKFLEDRWTIVLLGLLFLYLSAAHAYMIHYNRPQAVITWCENMMTGVFTALIAKLKD